MEEHLGIALELSDQRRVEPVTGPLSQVEIRLVMSETKLTLLLKSLVKLYFNCFSFSQDLTRQPTFGASKLRELKCEESDQSSKVGSDHFS